MGDVDRVSKYKTSWRTSIIFQREKRFLSPKRLRTSALQSLLGGRGPLALLESSTQGTGSYCLTGKLWLLQIREPWGGWEW